MLSIYPACFFKEDTGYSVVFPDLNHLATCGDTLDEAIGMAVDCLAGYLYTLKKEHQEAPKPSDMSSIDPTAVAADLDLPAGEAFVNMVAADVNDYAKTHFERSVKKTLTIPAWLNEAALEKNINFSQVLQEALKEKLHTI